MPTRSQFRDEILAAIEDTPVVDCHSHTVLRQNYEQTEWNLFNMMAYFKRDMASVIHPDEVDWQVVAPGDTDAERWQWLKGVLAKSRNVSYWRHNMAVYHGLFDFEHEELDDANWAQLNDTIKCKTKSPGWYDYLTRDRCRLRTAVRNIPWFEDWEPEYYTAILRMEGALQLDQQDTREQLARQADMELDSVEAATRALAAVTEQYVGRGAIGIKLAHAYWRTLNSKPVPQAAAEAIYQKTLAGQDLSEGEKVQLGDYMIYFLGGLATDMDLVFQIHTGVQSNWCNIPESDPLLLIPLLKAYPNVRFDLFHAGYPYSREMGMLGKHFPNTYLNMCWMYVITMEGSRQTLSEWIDLVPAHRLLGFGSDVFPPEFIYGHLRMAEGCIADVLTDKVRRDFLSRTAARDLVGQLLHDSPCELYRLNNDS